MSNINNDLIALLPMGQVASHLGVTPTDAVNATATALPVLLQGLTAVAKSSEARAQALFQAMAQDHDGSVLDQYDIIRAVDVNEGVKIVNHIFGSNTGAVIKRLGQTPEHQAVYQRLLPFLAPLAMGWLSRAIRNQAQQQQAASPPQRDVLRRPRMPQQTPAPAPSQPSGGGLGNVLIDVLGGGPMSAPSPAPQAPQQPSGGGGLGDILGGMLGGGGGGMGGLIDILGGLAGGGGGGRPAADPGSGFPDLNDILGGGR